MLKTGEIVELDNGKEYIIINKMELHNTKYAFLVSNFKPLEIVIGIEKEVNGLIVLQEIKDNEELDYILNRFIQEKEDSNKYGGEINE